MDRTTKKTCFRQKLTSGSMGLEIASTLNPILVCGHRRNGVVVEKTSIFLFDRYVLYMFSQLLSKGTGS